jgi:hypothetical protein
MLASGGSLAQACRRIKKHPSFVMALESPTAIVQPPLTMAVGDSSAITNDGWSLPLLRPVSEATFAIFFIDHLFF